MRKIRSSAEAEVELEDVEAEAKAIEEQIKVTPLVCRNWLSLVTRCPSMQALKAENEQLRIQVEGPLFPIAEMPNPGDGRIIFEQDSMLQHYKDHLDYRLVFFLPWLFQKTWKLRSPMLNIWMVYV